MQLDCRGVGPILVLIQMIAAHYPGLAVQIALQIDAIARPIARPRLETDVDVVGDRCIDAGTRRT